MGVGRRSRTGTGRTGPAGPGRRTARPPAGGILAVVAAAVVLLVVGCGRPAPSPSPTTPPPSPSPTSASPSPSPSTPPRGNGSRAPAGFVVLTDVDPTILTDIRYATPHNFLGRPVAGYREPLCLLTRQAAEALRRVQTAARARGYSLKVYDCYRPRQAGEDFVRWARRPADQQMKAEFFPRVDKSALVREGYIAGGADGHSRGGTVDLTLVAVPPPTQRPYVPGERLVSCTAPPGHRFPDNTVDMGTGFDCFDELSHTADPRVTGAARENRLLLKRLMGDAGFVNYAREWWHYRLAQEPYPDTYFDFPVARGAVAGG